MTNTCSIHTPCDWNPAATTGFCGPVAISAITGLSVHVIERTILERRAARNLMPNTSEHRKRVTGMDIWEMQDVFKALGFAANLVTYCEPARHRETLRHFASRLANTVTTAMLVIVTGHAVALHGWSVVDTDSIIPTHLAKRQRLARKRVKCAWAITKQGE